MRLAVVSLSSGKTIAARVRVADTFFTRLRGLLGTAKLPAGQALLLKPCDSVHTIGMRYPIDLIFLDVGGRVLKVAASLKPLRAMRCAGSRMVLELPAGTVLRTGVEAGHQLLFEEGGV